MPFHHDHRQDKDGTHSIPPDMTHAMLPNNDPAIGVLYLARGADGAAAMKRFVDSYIARPGGIEHDLWIAFKGFSSERAVADYVAAAPALAFNRIDVPDRGFDIGSYWHAAEHLAGRYRYLCFLNTHTEVLAQNWLRYMHRWAAIEGVGLVGATGSYESPYTDALGERSKHQLWLRRQLSAMKRPLRLWWRRICYPPFPNPHLRTNAFLLTWDLMKEVWPRRIYTKQAAFRFESGVNSLTDRVRQRGLKVLVVGRDGEGYDIERWPDSNTFRSGHHRNLLVADNRVRGFEAADPAEKLYLARMAWGDRIRPESI
jgi:hypothetical protein